MTQTGKVYSYPENFRSLKILISASYGGHDLSVDKEFQFGVTDLSKQYLSKFPLGKVPCVELSGGQLLDESNSACWLLCPDSMTGAGDKVVQSNIIRWMCLADQEVTPAACNWVYPLLGLMPVSPHMDRAKTELVKIMTWLNEQLRLKTWLVGERISLADICVASSMLLVFNNNVLDLTLKVKNRHNQTELLFLTLDSGKSSPSSEMV